ncbi:MAG: hypothetical protein ACK53Y_21020 [bacterium]
MPPADDPRSAQMRRQIPIRRQQLQVRLPPSLQVGLKVGMTLVVEI